MVFEISRKIFLKRGKCVAQMRHHVSSVSGWYSTTPILRDLGPQVSTEKKRFTPSPPPPVITPTPPIARKKRLYRSAVYKCVDVCPVKPAPAIRHPPTGMGSTFLWQSIIEYPVIPPSVWVCWRKLPGCNCIGLAVCPLYDSYISVWNFHSLDKYRYFL